MSANIQRYESKNELQEGIYDIPQGYRAIISGGKITIRKYRKHPIREGGLRCKDCKYFDSGMATYSPNYTTVVCKMKPKEMPLYLEGRKKKLSDDFQLYYAASPYDKICDKFEHGG